MLASFQPLSLSTAMVISALIVLLVSVLLYVFQSKLIYVPQFPAGSRQVVWTPERFGWGPGPAADWKDEDAHDFEWENVWLNAEDGVKLHAYWIKAKAACPRGTGNAAGLRQRHTDANASTNIIPTVLFFQANAGNIGHRLPIARELQRVVDCNIFMLSYRGYGHSEGVPNELGIKLDAKAAVNWTVKRLAALSKAHSASAAKFDSKIIAYGQSIGGAVAIYAAHAAPQHIHTVVLENTFLSIKKLVPAVAPILYPLTPLLHQQWPSERLIPSLRQRILFLVGESDELIPPTHCKTLLSAAKASRQRKIVTFVKGKHNDTCIQPGYFEAIRDFLASEAEAIAAYPAVCVEEVTDEEAL